MATRDEYDQAVGRVESGNGTERDYKLANKQARVAGNSGTQAREALKKDSKDSSKSWGNW